MHVRHGLFFNMEYQGMINHCDKPSCRMLYTSRYQPFVAINELEQGPGYTGTRLDGYSRGTYSVVRGPRYCCNIASYVNSYIVGDQ